MGREEGESYLWVVPVGLFTCGLCYVFLQRIAVRSVCKTFLQSSYGLEEEGAKAIAQRDINEISLLVLTWMMGAITSAVSILAMLETKHDTIYARSTLLIPWCHVAAPYYIIDTYAMAVTFMGQGHVVRRKPKTKVILFVLEKWPFLLHHVFVAIGYPIIVNDHFRGYKGDFYAAALLAQDLSNPLLANAKILNILGKTNNVFYWLNGALLIVVFLVLRVLFVPINVAVYAAQYHQWGFGQALRSMKTICHICNTLQFSLQAYWFLLLLKLAGKVVKDWQHPPNGSAGDKSHKIRTPFLYHKKKLI